MLQFSFFYYQSDWSHIKAHYIKVIHYSGKTQLLKVFCVLCQEIKFWIHPISTPKGRSKEKNENLSVEKINTRKGAWKVCANEKETVRR